MDKRTAEYIDKWLLKAEHDLITADTLLNLKPFITDVACFHCQQCAEKSLKAYLVKANVHIKKTHDLKELLDLCIPFEAGFSKLRYNMDFLKDYAVATRYPEEFREIPKEEAKEAFKLAEEVFQFVNEKLKQRK